jgi:hypothetical protein
MNDTAVAVDGVLQKPPRMIVGEQVSDYAIPTPIVRDVEPLLACPVCQSTNIVWSWRVEVPEFKWGVIICRKCDHMYDVTPRN